MQTSKYTLVILTIGFLVTACGGDRVNYRQLETFNADGSINAVVEIPAGTNQKIEYDQRKNKFDQEEVDGKPRQIDFLPYPGNYGYVAGTYLKESDGGDGDPLDILVIAESRTTGTVMKVKPIGVLLAEDKGQRDHKIIAIPIDPQFQIIQANSFMDLITEYDAVKQIIETWFLNYKGWGNMKLIRWQDGQFAEQLIKKSM